MGYVPFLIGLRVNQIWFSRTGQYADSQTWRIIINRLVIISRSRLIINYWLEDNQELLVIYSWIVSQTHITHDHFVQRAKVLPVITSSDWVQVYRGTKTSTRTETPHFIPLACRLSLDDTVWRSRCPSVQSRKLAEPSPPQRFAGRKEPSPLLAADDGRISTASVSVQRCRVCDLCDWARQQEPSSQSHRWCSEPLALCSHRGSRSSQLERCLHSD